MSATPRWATERTPDRDTFAPAVVSVAEALGIDLMPWQRQVLEVALEHDNGRLAYRDVGVAVPRQAGKSTLTLALIVWRLLAAPSQSAYGAQSRLAARQKVLDDWWPIIERSKLAKAFVQPTRATGQEALRTGSGSICRVISSDETAAHGQTLSLSVLDEAWALGPEAEQAVRPAMSTKRNGQLWSISTAGSARSSWWRAKVVAGREAVEQGLTSGVAYFEWSADPGSDLHDLDVWRACHPALGHTVDADTLAADIAAMAPPEARRAYLNVWLDDSDEDVGWGVINRDLWHGAKL